MKIAFYILTGLHAIIHCFGFLKAYNIVEFNAISQPISKVGGFTWLVVFLLLVTTLILNFLGYKNWWIIGIIAVLISQILIFTVWQDAKFGTVPNAIVLIACAFGFFDQNFTQMVNSERVNMWSHSNQAENVRLISDLPRPVQRWLENAGVDDSTRIRNVYLTQRAQLKMKPDQDNWYDAQADQYFLTNPPSFNWFVQLEMNPFLPVKGRDKLEDGKGEMQIKLFSGIPVVDAKNNRKIDQATLQRFLAEIVWFPSAARNKYIHWEEIDDSAVNATLTCNGQTGSGIFHFDKEGNFVKFSAMRYKGGGEDDELREWVVEAKEYKKMDGFYVPVKLQATWKLEDGDWTWLKLEVLNIKYNHICPKSDLDDFR